MIWREKRWLLIGLGLFLALNAVFFVTYRVRYEERVRDLDSRLDQTRSDYELARTSRIAAERELAAYKKASADIATVYDDWWATRKERLAPLIVELGDLAQKSGLIPQGRAYAVDESRGPKNVDVHASAMTITFSVQGPYSKIRQLINMIELSQHFIIIQQIGLADASGGGGAPGDTLTLGLSLKTLFRDEPQASGT